jgi:hypothetical protein
MSMQPGAASAAYLSQTLGNPSLSGARAHEMADLVAILADLGQHVADLSGLVGEAEGRATALGERLRRGSTSRSAAARALEEQVLRESLGQEQAHIRRLREALHDAQVEMERLHGQHGASTELDLLRAQCQQEDMRARAAEVQMAEHLGEQQQREQQQSTRRKQEMLRRTGATAGQTTAAAGSHLSAGSGQFGPQQSAWQPPEALQAQFEDVTERAGAYARRLKKGVSADGAEVFDEAATSSQAADVQARFANVLMHPSMPRFSDPADLVQWVMRQAHADGALDIQGYAHKLHFSTQLKEIIREELSRARKFRSDHAASLKDGVMDAPFDRLTISRDPEIGADGVPQVRPLQKAGEITRVEELDAHIADLQNMLASTGEDMQISQLELQNMMQRQQQVMNVLSNLSKALHETSMAIIRKIGN